MAAIGQQGEGQQGAEGGEAQQQTGPDLSALTGHLDQLAQGQQELRDYLQSQPWQAGEPAGEQQDQGPGEMDLSFLDGGVTGDPEADQAIAAQLAQRINQHIGEREQQLMQQMEEKFGQYDEKLSERERVEQARDLVEEFPEMGEQDTANQVVGHAAQLAEANGHPELASEPWFWRLTYMAGRAADAHTAEGQEAPGGAAHLEGGGGANLGGGDSQVDQFDRALKSKKGSSVLPFH